MSTEVLALRVWTDDELLELEEAKFWQLSDGDLYRSTLMPVREVFEDPAFDS